MGIWTSMNWSNPSSHIYNQGSNLLSGMNHQAVILGMKSSQTIHGHPVRCISLQYFFLAQPLQYNNTHMRNHHVIRFSKCWTSNDSFSSGDLAEFSLYISDKHMLSEWTVFHRHMKLIARDKPTSPVPENSSLIIQCGAP